MCNELFRSNVFRSQNTCYYLTLANRLELFTVLPYFELFHRNSLFLEQTQVSKLAISPPFQIVKVFDYAVCSILFVSFSSIRSGCCQTFWSCFLFREHVCCCITCPGSEIVFYQEIIPLPLSSIYFQSRWYLLSLIIIWPRCWSFLVFTVIKTSLSLFSSSRGLQCFWYGLSIHGTFNIRR